MWLLHVDDLIFYLDYSMKNILALLVTVAFSIPALAADQATAMDLAKRSGCLACHAVDKKLVGPAWNEVGKKYAGNRAAKEQLIAKVKNGTKGTWGAVPMPPNAGVADADVRTLVEFIVSLK